MLYNTKLSVIFNNTNNLFEETVNDKIHIYVKQRNAKKRLTFIKESETIENEITKKDLLKVLKKKLSCNGCIISHEEMGECIQLQGDKRQEIKDYLMNKYNLKSDIFELHGC